MLKSEMVAKIEQYLLKEFCEGVPKDSNGAWDSWQSAKNILDITEENGMLPPDHNLNEGSGVYGVPSYYVNQWETEEN